MGTDVSFEVKVIKIIGNIRREKRIAQKIGEWKVRDIRKKKFVSPISTKDSYKDVALFVLREFHRKYNASDHLIRAPGNVVPIEKEID